MMQSDMPTETVPAINATKLRATPVPIMEDHVNPVKVFLTPQNPRPSASIRG